MHKTVAMTKGTQLYFLNIGLAESLQGVHSWAEVMHRGQILTLNPESIHLLLPALDVAISLSYCAERYTDLTTSQRTVSRHSS